jgi:hypothetical protein
MTWNMDKCFSKKKKKKKQYGWSVFSRRRLQIDSLFLKNQNADGLNETVCKFTDGFIEIVVIYFFTDSFQKTVCKNLILDIF